MIDVDLYKEYITGTLDDCVKQNKRKFRVKRKIYEEIMYFLFL